MSQSELVDYMSRVTTMIAVACTGVIALYVINKLFNRKKEQPHPPTPENNKKDIKKQFNWQDETKVTLRKSIAELPVAADLPRLVRHVTINIRDEKSVSFSNPDHSLADQLRKFLTVLANELESGNSELPAKIEGQFTNSNVTTPSGYMFLDGLLDVLRDAPAIVKVLKIINQSFIAPAITSINFLSFSKGVMLGDLKGAEGGWTIEIKIPKVVKETERLTVIHRRKQRTLKGAEHPYRFAWELTVKLDETLECHSLSLKVRDFVFDDVNLPEEEKTKAIQVFAHLL
eukprot:TRINITY_DN2191_c0_g3_i1.p1 TRINITY_DN2191_c0_g3~~TRINITY_DN2191_c0_g3_i1.p1  ORF type:complete len:287 (-),score=50.50 TRINITY_DN2191_c0_g3_i1:116-976(-)